MRFEVFTAGRMMMMMMLLWVSEKHTVSIFRAEDGDSMFLRNVGIYRRVYTAPKPRGTTSVTCINDETPVSCIIFQSCVKILLPLVK
jgi:hypothetical protein